MAAKTTVVTPRPAPDAAGAPPPADGDGVWVRAAELRPLAAALTALADGDFTTRLTGTYEGPVAELATAVNRIAARNGHYAGELDRVRREVLRHGRFDERLTASTGRGAWTTNVHAANALLDALTIPVAGATRVLDAVASGDLTQRVPLHDGTRQLRGDTRRLGRAVNRTVDQLALFTGEVTRMAREVGTEGRLGGRAKVQGLQGNWRATTEAVNAMASRLTAQIRDIAQVTTAVAKGDLNRKVTVEAAGELLELKLTVNTMVDQLSDFAGEVTRVAREVGTEGQLGGRAQVRGASGVWKDLTDNVNFMADNLTSQVRNIAQVTKAVAQGDLSQQITVSARGEILQLKSTVNTMVDQLSGFADEVTRVAREVGTEGQLGGRAQVRGASGVWKDLTDNVNFMADNLTSQVRNIAQVATAVAQGDLSRKIDVTARGEILELKTTINTMVDTLSAFASEVTRVAREVGSEGRLGGQARVEGVYGTWKRLTTNVNELASNLTTQVRAIAEVASAVAQGDLTRAITVEAQGEVADLKDDVNLMVANLRETTRAKDWLETNLARLASLMQGHRDLIEVADLIIRELTPLVNAQFGAFYLAEDATGSGDGLVYIAGYGTAQGEIGLPAPHTPGRGLVQQVAVQKERILLEDVPPDYITIASGLGEAVPKSVVILPVVFEHRVLGVIELASFNRFSDVHLAFFDQFGSTIGVAINTIVANSRTESLLSESQRLTQQLRDRSDELQRQQAELRRSNDELEVKAAQLAAASQYKSEFLANMSHELRTPLNSLLILARLLADNADGHLSEQEVQFAETINRSGTDLLTLINDILDLSKIEAGRMDVRPRQLPLVKVLNYVHDTFRPLTLDRGLAFEVAVGEDVPRVMMSDGRRLQQILRNLLSNAVKFTPTGKVELRVDRVPTAESNGHELVDFAVCDTGIGIDSAKLATVFEAFQQADGTTNRKYGGTGLGLSISREIAGLLGGTITATSRPGKGSVFTLRVPVRCPGPVETEEPVRLPDAPAGLPALFQAPPEPPEPADLPHDPEWLSTTRLEEWISGRPGEVFPGNRVLIVDDDIRNVFALTHVLGRVGMSVLYAENGREGIEVLEKNPDIALCLMDIMMPELDGYETIQRIRSTPRFAALPIIALTAKAMPGDREKAIGSGASDYVPKPVDVDRLLTASLSLLDPDTPEAGQAPA
ncbi:Sensor histidine kinase RcsC [Streptomyces sp. RB5]|uniref:Circadian input-output histidine kinase CikA n=1 Tax=Streptomyces smaragdinus TaxID=2585196 RepID=A0A7K0CDZ1_9ACTN|nr:HAMP domain-containing protein [Streptomyces smaragdinus]MQY11586.1 Sensor histidine kinase RcsC [Streptomyces smaragdinus]